MCEIDWQAQSWPSRWCPPASRTLVLILVLVLAVVFAVQGESPAAVAGWTLALVVGTGVVLAWPAAMAAAAAAVVVPSVWRDAGRGGGDPRRG